MSIILDDITAWDKFPNSRWMLDKLYVQQKMGYDCGPLGVEPSKYPVWVKPVINLYGMGIKSRLMHNKESMYYEPGMMWTQYYTGDHMSYDITYENNGISSVYAAKGLNGPNFTEWQVDKIKPNDTLKYLVYRLSIAGQLPQHFNIETIGGKLIECHPRWSEEFIHYYNECPFTQKVLWSENIEEELPMSWVDCRDDSANQIIGKLKRIGYTYKFKEK